MAAVLDTDVLVQALAARQLIVAARKMAETVREPLHRVRLDMIATLDRRQREEQERAAVVGQQSMPSRDRRPVPLRPSDAVEQPL